MFLTPPQLYDIILLCAINILYLWNTRVNLYIVMNTSTKVCFNICIISSINNLDYVMYLPNKNGLLRIQTFSVHLLFCLLIATLNDKSSIVFFNAFNVFCVSMHLGNWHNIEKWIKYL